LNKEWRLQEAEQKKQQKEEDRVAKEAAKQLQNDIENTKNSKKVSKSSTIYNTAVADPPAPKVVCKMSTKITARPQKACTHQSGFIQSISVFFQLDIRSQLHLIAQAGKFASHRGFGDSKKHI
jgi:Zn-dependent M16 (insulinase) family peptidase